MATVAEEMTALQSQMDALQTRLKSEKETTNKPSELERIADRLSLLSADRVQINRETKHFPLWKPLSADDIASSNYAQSGIASRVAAAVPDASKAIDSTGVGPLIRQDLEPEIYETYVKNFPLYDMIDKIPANGLVHAWNQETSFGDAQFIAETGVVTDDVTTYGRLTANIAVMATRRGISLKAKFAVRAGGMNYDPETRELQSGIRAIAHKTQAAIVRYQDTISSATTATDPNGLYDANSFNGLRYYLQNVCPAANTFYVDGRTAPAAQTHPITDAVQAAANAVMDAGGTPSMIIASITGRQKVISEQTSFVRFDLTNSQEVIPGVHVPKIVAGETELPIMVIPGDAIGSYIVNTAGTVDKVTGTFVDLYVVDMDQLAWAYLGGPAPTVLDIPTGTDGTLRHLMIPFIMGGFVPYVPQYLSRVQIQTA